MAWEKYVVAPASGGGVTQPAASYHTLGAAITAWKNDGHDGAHEAEIEVLAGRYAESVELPPGLSLTSLGARGAVVVAGNTTVGAGAGVLRCRGIVFDATEAGGAALVAQSASGGDQALVLDDCELRGNGDAALGVDSDVASATLRRCRLAEDASQNDVSALRFTPTERPLLLEDTEIVAANLHSPAVELSGSTGWELRRCVLSGIVFLDAGGQSDLAGTLRETHVACDTHPAISVTGGPAGHLPEVTLLGGSLDARGEGNVWADGCDTRHGGVVLLGATTRGGTGQDTQLTVV